MITEEKINVLAFKLIGITLPSKTTNENGQSGIDCGNLWQKFINENVISNIPNKISDEIYAVYYNYDGDHTKPYSYFIGCKVDEESLTPDGMESIKIKKGIYQKVIAKGKMPYCIGDAWMEIWNSTIVREYATDYEIYGEKSQDWNNAEVDIYIGIK